MRVFKHILIAVIVLAFSSLVGAQGSEEITLTTYYPAPYGDYDELTAHKMTIGTTYPVPANDGDLTVEGRVGIGTTDPQAKLDVSTTTSGFLPPRMTTSERNAIINPAEGSILYNTTAQEVNFRDASNWQSLGGSGGCYLSYSGSCLTGFTNKGSAGSWGRCYTSGSIYRTHFRPPGGGCGVWSSGTAGEAYVCCQ